VVIICGPEARVALPEGVLERAVQQQLRGEVAQLKVTQDQLLAERDQARAQLAAAQQEGMVLTKLLEEIQDKASITGSVSPPMPASKPPRTPAQTKGKGR